MKKILVIELGTVELFWAMEAQLISMGFELYIYSPNQNIISDYQKRGLFKTKFNPKEIDLVITANLFDGNTILQDLKQLNLSCPILMLCLTHPIKETIDYWQTKGLKGLNKYLKDNKLFLWIPCKFAAKEWELLGFTNGIYSPFGLYDKIPNLGNHLFTWLNKNEHPLFNRSELIQQTKIHHNFNDNEFVDYSMLYLGNLEPENTCEKDDNFNKYDKLAKEVQDFCISDPASSRLTFPNINKILFSEHNLNIINNFYIFNKQFFYHYSENCRLKFIKYISEKYPEKFLLYGDCWKTKNIKSQNTNSNIREYLYSFIPLSLDFGSMSFETCYFPRSIEIVNCDGFLLSYLRPDTKEIFGEYTLECTFSNTIEFNNVVNDIFANNNKRLKDKDKIKNYLLENYSFSKSFSILFEKIDSKL